MPFKILETSILVLWGKNYIFSSLGLRLTTEEAVGIHSWPLLGSVDHLEMKGADTPSYPWIQVLPEWNPHGYRGTLVSMFTQKSHKLSRTEMEFRSKFCMHQWHDKGDVGVGPGDTPGG